MTQLTQVERDELIKELDKRLGITALTLRIIALEEKVRQISAPPDLTNPVQSLSGTVEALSVRVTTLERARERQIALNETFVTKVATLKYDLRQPEPPASKSLWEQLKDRIKPL